jgi:hypothetical protein
VAIRKVGSQRIYAIGSVNKPGEFPIGRCVNVLRAPSMAGGLRRISEPSCKCQNQHSCDKNSRLHVATLKPIAGSHAPIVTCVEAEALAGLATTDILPARVQDHGPSQTTRRLSCRRRRVDSHVS